MTRRLLFAWSVLLLSGGCSAILGIRADLDRARHPVELAGTELRLEADTPFDHDLILRCAHGAQYIVGHPLPPTNVTFVPADPSSLGCTVPGASVHPALKGMRIFGWYAEHDDEVFVVWCEGQELRDTAFPYELVRRVGLKEKSAGPMSPRTEALVKMARGACR